MAVDWDGESHDEIDQLMTERNSARAEAALWQRRLMTMQQERDQARADLRAAEKSHAEWERAYDELLQQFRRLEVQANNIRFDYEAAHSVVDFLIERRLELPAGSSPSGSEAPSSLPRPHSN